MARPRPLLATLSVLVLGLAATAPAIAAGDGAQHASATFIDSTGVIDATNGGSGARIACAVIHAY